MNLTNPIAQVLSTFAGLEKDLIEAQKGPMDPKIRAELARLAASTRVCLARLGESHVAASERLAAKRANVAASVAKNRQAIKAKKTELAEEKSAADSAPKPTPQLDPTLGVRLATELLSRQLPAAESKPKQAAGVLDQWEWAAANPAVEAVANQ